MSLITCQALPCASLVGALLAEIPVVLPKPRRKRPGYLLSTPRLRRPTSHVEEGRQEVALLWLRTGEQCPLFSSSPDVSSYVIQYRVQ